MAGCAGCRVRRRRDRWPAQPAGLSQFQQVRQILGSGVIVIPLCHHCPYGFHRSPSPCPPTRSPSVRGSLGYLAQCPPGSVPARLLGPPPSFATPCGSLCGASCGVGRASAGRASPEALCARLEGSQAAAGCLFMWKWPAVAALPRQARVKDDAFGEALHRLRASLVKTEFGLSRSASCRGWGSGGVATGLTGSVRHVPRTVGTSRL